MSENSASKGGRVKPDYPQFSAACYMPFPDWYGVSTDVSFHQTEPFYIHHLNRILQYVRADVSHQYAARVSHYEKRKAVPRVG
jgi:hypothetical protein